MGCGGTRALHVLMQGDFMESMRFHPLIIPAIFLFGIYAVLFFIKGRSAAKKLDKIMLIFSIIAFVLFIVRMILFFPNTEPMTFNFDSIVGRIYLLIMSNVT